MSPIFCLYLHHSLPLYNIIGAISLCVFQSPSLALCLPLGLVSTALPPSLQILLNNPVRPARATSPRASRCTNEAHCCQEGLRLSSCLSCSANKQTRRLIRPNLSSAIGAICLSVHVSVHILQRMLLLGCLGLF